MKLFTAFTCFSATVWVCFMNTVITSSVRKCCDLDEVFENVNGTYQCSKNDTRRLQIKTKETGFFYQNNTGECVEILNDFVVFNVSVEVAVPLGQVTETIFPKCCHLNYVYNSIIHSCEERQNLNHSYIEANYLQIGLPNCRIIADYEWFGLINTRNNLGSIGSYCIDKTHMDSFVLRKCKETIEVCNKIRCLKKCCPDGQSFIETDTCYDTYKFGLNVSKWQDVIQNSTGK